MSGLVYRLVAREIIVCIWYWEMDRGYQAGLMGSVEINRDFDLRAGSCSDLSS